MTTGIEQEANLFAIALLTDHDFDKKVTIPLSNMNNYILKSIMDYNIRTEE